MFHCEALKAVARKRLNVIYALMRDKVPARPSPAKMEESCRADGLAPTWKESRSLESRLLNGENR